MDNPLSDNRLAQRNTLLIIELEETTKERDDARRELIAYDSLHSKTSVVASAKARGWSYLITKDKKL